MALLEQKLQWVLFWLQNEVGALRVGRWGLMQEWGASGLGQVFGQVPACWGRGASSLCLCSY